MRIFTGIGLSDQLRDNLAETLSALRAGAVKGRFTPPENLHLTLVFIGEAEDARAARRAIEETAFTGVRIRLGRPGRFARPGGDIVWRGVERDEGLEQLYLGLRAALARNGLKTEDRPYRPHITLGRQVVLPPGLRAEELPHEPGEMFADTLTLFESRRTEEGLRYLPIFEYNRRLS